MLKILRFQIEYTEIHALERQAKYRNVFLVSVVKVIILQCIKEIICLKLLFVAWIETSSFESRY